MDIDIAKLKIQAKHVNEVMVWLRSLAFNERLLEKLEEGKEDESIYSKERIQNKIDKLMASEHARNPDHLKSKDLQKVIMRLEDEMNIYRPLVVSKTHGQNVKYHEKLSELTDQSKEAEMNYYISLENIDREMFNFNSNIYKLILDGTDMKMVYYTMNMFDKMQKGKISVDKGAKECCNNAEKRYKLPKGFFDPVLKK